MMITCQARQFLLQRLKDESVLSAEAGYLLFTRDEEFSSSSAAAAVIHGGHANGLIAWKNKNGKTLKKIESVHQANSADAKNRAAD